MDFKKLHEDLVTMVEKTIDPKFRDAIKRHAEGQRKVYTDRAANYRDRGTRASDPDWYETQAKEYDQKAKRKQPSELVYKNLARLGLDVEKSTIKYLGNAQDFDSKSLKKELKQYIDKEDTNRRCYLIYDTNYDSYSEYGVDSHLRVYRVDYDYNGQFELSNWNPDNSFATDKKGRTFMADLNRKDIKGDLYVAFGISSRDIQKEREQRQKGRVLRNVGYSGDLDKSGYDLYQAQKDLNKRLGEYKRNKGTYVQDVEQVNTKWAEIVTKIKTISGNIDLADDWEIKKLTELLKSANWAATKVQWLADSIKDSSRDTDSHIRKSISDCNELITKLEDKISKMKQ